MKERRERQGGEGKGKEERGGGEREKEGGGRTWGYETLS